MAEASDRPHAAEPVSANAASAEERVATPPQSLAAPRGNLGAVAPMATETYRPLSLLALTGFGLAVVYALVVLIGAAVALVYHIPWLMPGWTFLLPLVALILCWAARTRILGSEETLSGLAFTTWGLRFAIVVALTYAAYYAATFFAVRGQAIECADTFFDYLKQGHPEQAFLLSKGEPVNDVDRDKLELRFNTPKGGPGTVGELTRFRQARYVRCIEMERSKANITLKGVSEWEHGKGGYRVVLRYHIATAFVAFDMDLETFGRDSKPGEPKKGWQWQIVLPMNETAISAESWKMTPHGDEVMQKLHTANQFASAWIEKINLQQWSEAYRDTRAPSERSGLSESALRKGWNNLQQPDKLIRIDEKRFWAGKQQRADIIQRVRNSFQPGNPSCMLSLATRATPLARESDGQITVLFDVNLRYVDETTRKDRYIVQGQLVVTTRETDAASSPSAWRVEALDIESGRTPPEPRRSPKP